MKRAVKSEVHQNLFVQILLGGMDEGGTKQISFDFWYKLIH